MSFKRFWLVFSFFFALFWAGCRKEESITSDSSARLEFSSDTVRFDTVFTQIGSTTRVLRIYNTNSDAIKIASLHMAKGIASQFIMNVDGVSGNQQKDVIIPANDSIYVFVEVTVNPTAANSPFVIKDSIMFEFNGNRQHVLLEAWGQNAYYHAPSSGYFFNLACNDVWSNDKPHVIYGGAVIAPGCKLTINAGARVYVHGYSLLAADSAGTLDIKGSSSDPVTFQGDRLEPEYKDLPGQWATIWLSKGSKNNTIDWAIIKNAGIGIRVDSLPYTGNSPSLSLSNTIIKNMSTAAIIGQGAKIYSSNCVFANCGQSCAYLNIGGRYSFVHCTFANYWNTTKPGSSRSTPAVVMNNYYKDVNENYHSRPLDSAYFGNCIVYGALDAEVGLDSSQGGAFNYKFDHCLLKSNSTIPTSNSFHFNACVLNLDPAFKDKDKNDYKINSSSGGKDLGDQVLGAKYIKDLADQIRQIPPDIGAYEETP